MGSLPIPKEPARQGVRLCLLLRGHGVPELNGATRPAPSSLIRGMAEACEQQWQVTVVGPLEDNVGHQMLAACLKVVQDARDLCSCKAQQHMQDVPIGCGAHLACKRLELPCGELRQEPARVRTGTLLPLQLPQRFSAVTRAPLQPAVEVEAHVAQPKWSQR